MSVVIVLVAVVILGGIVVVALGRGGELARDAGKEASIADFESGADVARYRPPPALLGYHARTTEHALLIIGRAVADRDAEIAWLRSRLRELQPEGEREVGTLRDLSVAGDLLADDLDPTDPQLGQPQAGPGLPPHGASAVGQVRPPEAERSPVIQGSQPAHTGEDA